MPAEIPPAPAPAAAAPAAALLPAALAVSSVAPAAAQASAGDCRARFAERRWRIATETCAAAFEARPDDATLALKVAKALHARGRLADAGTWAARTIALDARAAEAFAILAHAEARAGRPTEALQAYRRYLALAPRGWHAAEARAALRASSPTRAAAPSDPADERADNGG
jgi:Flp pilus assembly protein TadD